MPKRSRIRKSKAAHATPKAARRTRRHAKPVKRAAFSSRQIRAALNAYRQVQDQLQRRGMDILALAEHLGTAAVAEYRQRLHSTLLEERILDDLAAISRLLTSPDSGYPGEELARFKLLPTALLQWIETHLGLCQHLHIGEEAEIPAADLSAFELVGSRPDALPSLVRIRVVGPGWNLDRKPLVPPRVELC
jgi:hypothetical protein